MKIARKSGITGKTNTMELDVTLAQLAEWQNGGYLQDVFAHLTADEREFLHSGVTPEEWSQYIGDDED